MTVARVAASEGAREPAPKGVVPAGERVLHDEAVLGEQLLERNERDHAAMRERLPTITPRTYAWGATAATISLALIVATGAGVRLTGSGLGCTNWPTCDGDVIAPATVYS